ncbi:glycosyltransferase family 24 protein [Ascoidea rubescens DSM 1968]|uniref:Glycosyltransferase family 24 protein n=1 Tax=Ascoidea rubescens DSM 1968 TaxID=1344418 RepID=A0A1D2VMY5_9ASCO|nr:glycosyltransferase family 24 protein [Ascoidea rubescens DSM 1968]ODV62981.1 glycosyltransferase family 24 protein [Ascoidea rubescens DSM 1968]
MSSSRWFSYALLLYFSYMLAIASSLASSQNSVNVKLYSSWLNPPFALQILETISNQNESLYLPTILKLLNINDIDALSIHDIDAINSIDLSDACELSPVFNDKFYYDNTFNTLLNNDSKLVYDIYLANHYYSPTVISHYNYYNSSVIPNFNIPQSSPRDSWILFDDKIISDPTDLFALQIDNSNNNNNKINELILPFDRVIGNYSTNNLPLLILYGNINDPSFKNFFISLYQNVLAKKLNFVWRYIPEYNTKIDYELLSGYGVDLTLKRTDYIVIDDRDVFNNSNSNSNSNSKQNSNIEKIDTDDSDILNTHFSDIQSVPKKRIKNLDLKLVNYVLNYSNNSYTNFKRLIQILNDFPKFSNLIAFSKSFKINKKRDQKIKNIIDITNSNSKIGLSKDSIGLYINGKPLSDSKFNFFNLINLFNNELNLIHFLKKNLKLSTFNSKSILTRFAFMLTYLRRNFKSNSNNLFKRFNLNKNSHILGDKFFYLNDIESDSFYSHLKIDRSIFLQQSKEIRPGQLPNLKENLFDMIFVLNLNDDSLLNIAMSISSLILDRGIPQRIGFLPILQNASDKNEDEKLINKLLFHKFYKTGYNDQVNSKKDLYSFLERLSNSPGKVKKELLDHYNNNEDDYNLDEYDNSFFLKNYAIKKPYIIIDGVFTEFDKYNQWQYAIANQLYKDVNLIAKIIQENLSSKNKEFENKKLIDYLYEKSLSSRNLKIMPEHDNIKGIDDGIIDEGFTYKFFSEEFFKTIRYNEKIQENTVEFQYEKKIRRINSEQKIPITTYLIGDFNSKPFLKEVVELLKMEYSLFEYDQDYKARIKLVNTAIDNSNFKKIKESLTNKNIGKSITLKDTMELVVDIIERNSNLIEFKDQHKQHFNKEVISLLKSIDIDIEAYNYAPVIIVNSRLIKFNSEEELFTEKEIDFLVLYEIENRLKPIDILRTDLDISFKNQILIYQKTEITLFKDYYDWFELLSTVLTKSFFDTNQVDYQIGEKITRYDLSSITYEDVSIEIGNENAKSVFRSKDLADLEIVAIIDPISEESQKILTMLDGFTNLARFSNLCHITILLQPDLEMSEISIKRFYRGLYLSNVTFDSDSGEIDRNNYNAKFENVPEKTLFTLDMDVSTSWIVMPKTSIWDLDNIKLDSTEFGYVEGIYELRNILIEGHSKDIEKKIPPVGAQVELIDVQDKTYSDTNIMANLGYLQLKSNPGLWKFQIKPNSKSREIYSINDIFIIDNEGKKISRNDSYLGISDMNGLTIFPRFVKNPGMEGSSLIIKNDQDADDFDASTFKKILNLDGIVNKLPRLLKNVFNKISGKDNELVGSNYNLDKADINIFTIASGHLYERFLSIMTASVRKHTKHSIKFWLIENFMSPSFKEFLPYLAKKYDFKYELITYKWPFWLRPQREKQRTFWGYKILFLDVIFPQDLDKVIFVDSDQICRTDLKELVDLNLKGAPYGYTPMCDSRKEMEGFRFWKQGYWANLLGDEYKYHISALYVIDLKKFRGIAAGDRLRQHYQSLSADPNSLSNLDQDLPNNLQKEIKIFSLPQDWLWCETWCSDESLRTAKTIDLCNNPLTREPKLDRARRQIKEWSDYDDEITALREEAKQIKAVELKEAEIHLVSASDSADSAASDSEEDFDADLADFHDEL